MASTEPDMALSGMLGGDFTVSSSGRAGYFSSLSCLQFCLPSYCRNHPFLLLLYLSMAPLPILVVSDSQHCGMHLEWLPNCPSHMVATRLLR